MRKGQKKRVWTAEQKAEIVCKHLNDHISVRTLEKEYNADRSMICRWVKEYIAEGESSMALSLRLLLQSTQGSWAFYHTYRPINRE